MCEQASKGHTQTDKTKKQKSSDRGSPTASANELMMSELGKLSQLVSNVEMMQNES